MNWYSRPSARAWRSGKRLTEVPAFHSGIPGYTPTRSIELPELAERLNVGRVFVKEEAARLGLPAFKILGASYAVSRALSARFDRPGSTLSVEQLRREAAARPPLRLVAATDGNHGRAVARMARLIGVEARIHVPRGLTTASLNGIRSEGAELVESDLGYDEVVALAASDSAGDGERSVHIQDTAWQGYEEIPQWIVDGYATLFQEADQQLQEARASADVVFVPVGVGSLAQAAVEHYRSGTGPGPAVVSVEPDTADPVLTSLRAGLPVEVATSETIMTGLNCGVVSSTAWPVLHDGMDAATTVTDDQARAAVLELEGLGVDAGPCGAATLAAAISVLGNDRRREELGLNDEPTVLLVSTEGRAANPFD